LLALYTTQDVADAAWPVIPVIAAASCVYGLFLIKANIAFIRLRTDLLFRVNSASVIVSLCLNVVLLLLFPHVTMAAVAALVAYTVSYVWLSKSLAHELASFSIDTVWLARIVLATAGMLVALVVARSQLEHPGGIATLAQVVGGAIVYAALMLVQSPVRSELALLVRALRR
jgi:O-antigen/teichoic acid export membrane protein